MAPDPGEQGSRSAGVDGQTARSIESGRGVDVFLCDLRSQARRRELAEHVRRVFADSRQTSGWRRVARQLNREGHECSVGLVADLMRELGLQAVQRAAASAPPSPARLRPTALT